MNSSTIDSSARDSRPKSGLARHLPSTDWLSKNDGPRLAFCAYPAEHPWLHLLISHGFSEHHGWWHHVAEGFRAAGISTYTFDHYHHGVSEGAPGDVRDYGELVRGLRLALDDGVMPHVKNNTPIAVLGHSNGGLALLHLLHDLPEGQVSAVVLSNPLLAMQKKITWYAFPLARLLHLVWPGMMVPTPSFAPMLTSDRRLWREYRRDPLRFHRSSVQFFYEIFLAARTAFETASCKELPLLLLWGGRDVVVERRATLDWFDRVISPKKQRIDFPKLRHELFQEPVWPDIINSTVAWLREQAKGQTKTAEKTTENKAKPSARKTPAKSSSGGKSKMKPMAKTVHKTSGGQAEKPPKKPSVRSKKDSRKRPVRRTKTA